VKTQEMHTTLFEKFMEPDYLCNLDTWGNYVMWRRIILKWVLNR